MKFNDLSGQKFNKWTVLEYIGIIGKSRDRAYLCRCECGFEKPVRGYYLTNGYSKQCVTCAHTSSRKYRKMPHGYWRNLENNAKKRGIAFSITQDQVYDLYIKQNKVCALSGIPIYFPQLDGEHLKGLTTASVDRIDSSKGYTKKNIQLVHKHINLMKNVLSETDFVYYCRKVVETADSIDHHTGKLAQYEQRQR